MRLQCPCGLVVATVAADGSVRFESVPSFVYALDRVAPTPAWGPVTVDIA
ncbi:proline racemase family protein, partial [Vibrio parahaemolyticus]